LSDPGPQRLKLSPSTAYAAIVVAVHGAAAVSLHATLPGLPGTALAVLVLGLGCAAAWNRALLRGTSAPRAIEISPSGDARVLLAGGDSVPVRAVRGIGVTRHWVALAPAGPGGRSVLLTTGMLGQAGARRLRLWALWGSTGRALPAPLPS